MPFVKDNATFVKDNARELFGSTGCAAVESVKRKAWQRCEMELRAAGGPEHPGGWDAIRRKWSDATYRAKIYSRKLQGRNVTGTVFHKFVYKFSSSLLLRC